MMRDLRPIDEWKISPRVTIRPGNLVRFCGGGPEYRGRRFTLPGKFAVRRIFREGNTQRVFVEARGIDRVGGTYLVMIGGRAFRSQVLMQRPYKIKRAK